MSGPFIFIATNRLRPGALEAERRRVPQLSEFVETNDPRLLAFNEYVDDDGTEVAVVQVHPDAESMEFHMGVVREQAERAYAETLEGTTSIQVYGMPSDAVLDMFKAPGWLATFPNGQAAPSRRLHTAQPLMNPPRAPAVRLPRVSLRAIGSRVGWDSPRVASAAMGSIRTAEFDGLASHDGHLGAVFGTPVRSVVVETNLVFAGDDRDRAIAGLSGTYHFAGWPEVLDIKWGQFVWALRSIAPSRGRGATVQVDMDDERSRVRFRCSRRDAGSRAGGARAGRRTDARARGLRAGCRAGRTRSRGRNDAGRPLWPPRPEKHSVFAELAFAPGLLLFASRERLP